MSAKKPFTKEIRARWRKVKAAILAEPKLYNQGSWGAELPGRKNDPRSCGYPACLAGWYYAFASPEDQRKFEYDAAGLVYRDTNLGIEITDSHALHWPEPFESRYRRAKTKRTRARVAAARIDHLLATGE